MKTPDQYSIMSNNKNKLKIQYDNLPLDHTKDNIVNTTAFCNTSASHTYGNVLGIVEKHLLDRFPNETFKTVMATTALANKQIRHLPHYVYKKTMPMMVLVPRIQFGQSDNRFLANTYFNMRTNDTHPLWGQGSLIRLAQDKRKNIYISGHYNRALMYVDVIMSFNTYSEQMNWMSYLFNMIPIMHNQSIIAPLELYIPKDFCYLISKLAKVDMYENKCPQKFLNYMNSIWSEPITYLHKGGSNTDEFFMYYVTDIDFLIQNEPQADTGIKEGQTKRAFNITFTIKVEFNTIGYFTLDCPDIKYPVHIREPEGDIISMFSDVINLNDFKLPIGWAVYSWPIFKLDYEEDTISFDNILNDAIRYTIDYHLKMGIPIEKFLRIEFRENGEILHNEQFEIDWYRRKIKLYNPNYRRTYRLIITTNEGYINELIKDVYGLE